jgi:predicted  nucleic acid-binding Zn-ribbon protein
MNKTTLLLEREIESTRKQIAQFNDQKGIMEKQLVNLDDELRKSNDYLDDLQESLQKLEE